MCQADIKFVRKKPLNRLHFWQVIAFLIALNCCFGDWSVYYWHNLLCGSALSLFLSKNESSSSNRFIDPISDIFSAFKFYNQFNTLPKINIHRLDIKRGIKNINSPGEIIIKSWTQKRKLAVCKSHLSYHAFSLLTCMASSAVYRQLTFYFIVIHKFHSSMSYGKYARLIEIEYCVFYSVWVCFHWLTGGN